MLCLRVSCTSHLDRIARQSVATFACALVRSRRRCTASSEAHILPVVPWGVSNALLAGGRTPDLLLFGGLAVYAIAGCWAQDLRVANEEGSVGTTLEQGALSSFFRATSFAPFGAVLAGRQSLEDVRREVPWSALAAGLVVGAAIEWATLEWWVGVGGPPL